MHRHSRRSRDIRRVWDSRAKTWFGLWIVPARVEGSWRLADGELVLNQTFQEISGTMRTGHRTVPIAGGRLRGQEIYIRTNDNEYRGRISGDAIFGTSKNGAEWKATRLGANPGPRS